MTTTNEFIKEQIQARIDAINLLNQPLRVNNVEVTATVLPEITVWLGIDEVAEMFDICFTDESEKQEGSVKIIERYIVVDGVKLVNRDYKSVLEVNNDADKG